VVKGGTQIFSAVVEGANSPAQSVTWSVTGGKIGTGITTYGVLTVAADESATSLTVRAASTVDNTKSGTATVTVIPATGSLSITIGFNYGEITITGSDGWNTISKNGYYSFTLTLSAAGYTGVVWYIDGDGTGIPDTGGGITINAASYRTDSHTVTFTGVSESDGVLYSQLIPFTVIQ
jgi:hypothetical protein